MRVIDTEEYIEKEYAIKEYTEEDFMLVRTTDYLSEDHILRPLCDIPFVTNINSVAYSALFNILREKNNINVFNEEECEKLQRLAKENSPLSSQYRSTVHFTLNGLVTSHEKGNFDNLNFKIIDRLNKHLGKENFISIRMEDTFIQGEVKLSDDSIILIDESKYNDLKSKYPYIDTYNVILYKGDEKKAVEMILQENNIIPEQIQQHSQKETDRSSYIREELDIISKKYSIGQEKHCNTEIYKEDDEKNIELWNIYDKYFYERLFSNFGIVDDKAKEFLLDSKTERTNKIELFKEIILEIGLDDYMSYVKEYNKELKEKVDNKVFPNNKKILEDNDINILEEDLHFKK